MDIIKKWAKEQGFETFAADHQTVLSNLEKFIKQKFILKLKCAHCGGPVTVNNGYLICDNGCGGNCE